MQQSLSLPLSLVFLAGSYLSYTPAIAQITPDGTTSTTVNVNGDIVEINDGDIAGGNLFHSFQDFSVPNGGEAAFNNPDIIENIFSRVTGGNMSNIDGLIRANGNANLFLINPAGIIFGEGARLDLGGSFYGSTADSILFPDNIEFSASNLNSPVLTINAPIGLGFRDNPGEVINRSQVTDDTGEDLIGLRVTEDQTLALIGGDVSIEGGLITAFGGRIELGSIRENSNVSLTPIGGGFDIGYEEVVAFRDISLSNAALVTVNDANTTDIEVQGRNISLSQGSLIGITGQTGKIDINASESLSLDGNAAEVDLGNFPTAIFSRVSGDFTEETPSINIDTSKLSLTNGAQIEANNDIGAVQGVDININASEIILETLFERDGLFFVPVIASQVFEEGTGNGGNINITTATLTLNDGAQITTDTFGSGNGGDLIVNASESIELNGTIPDEINTPSALFANVGIPFFPISSAGNAGDITINTPQLTVSNGAQIATTAQNNGNGGNITFNISDSILITGTSPSAELGGTGRSGIFVNVEPSFEEFITDFDTGEETLTGEIIPTTGNGGNLTLNAGSLIIEEGALISADTVSLGDGGNANINVEQLILRDGGSIGAGSLLGVENLDTERGSGGTLNIDAESIEITGTGDINGEPVNSSIFTLAESNGDAGDVNLTTDELSVSDGGEINTSATDLGAAGNLTIRANNLDLNQGTLNAQTAAATGGNITLDIDDNITLSSESLISAAATGDANGGNIDIDTTFIIANSQGNSDILANAQQGTGGRIEIDAESIFGLQVRPPRDSTNDIDASGGVDGQVIINTPDVDITRGLETPQNLVEPEQSVAQACQSTTASEAVSDLVIKGKGGIPPEPTEPFIADSILGGEQIDSNKPQIHSPDIQPIKTSIGDIYPARGIVRTENGEVILTAYSTDSIDTRTPHNRANCS